MIDKTPVISEFQEKAPSNRKQASMPWWPFTDEFLLGYAVGKGQSIPIGRMIDTKLAIGGLRVRRVTVTDAKVASQPLHKTVRRGK